MRTLNRLGLATVFALLAAASVIAPAQAAVYTLDWRGTLTDGEDTTGIFGHPGSLIGEAVSLKFKIDTGTPGAVHSADALGSYISGRGAASPVIASVTIKGVTHALITHDVYVPTAPYVVIERNDSEPTRAFAGEIEPFANADQLFNYVDQTDNVQVFDEPGNQLVNIFHNTAEAAGTSYLNDFTDKNIDTAPLNYVFGENDLNVYAYFNISQIYFTKTINDVLDYSYNDAAFGNFTPISVSVSVEDAGGGGGVPEPAAWAMMLVGFGIVGGALRTKQPVAHHG